MQRLKGAKRLETAGWHGAFCESIALGLTGTDSERRGLGEAAREAR